MANLIVFTDLDGTLLDHETYSFDLAQPALNQLRAKGIPLVIVTSKTRAEVAELRESLHISGADITENGAWSRSYEWICRELDEAATQTDVPIRTFHQMTPEEIAGLTNLPVGSAAMAAQRESSEPFTILDHDRSAELLAALETRGLKWTRGGRFYHVFEKGSKGEAVREFQDQLPGSISIGLGDAPNDISFLSVVDHPVIIRSSRVEEMISAIPNAPVTSHTGPTGWNDAILQLLQRIN